jgi:hypothetical protein
MAVEAKRGCGFRKVGGLYMVGGKLGAPCCKMPIPLHVCPTCSGGVKQTRGWTWIDPRPWLAKPCSSFVGIGFGSTLPVFDCPAANPERLGERVGLLWIGGRFYSTPEDFAREANELGISRRLTAIPRNFKLGETWVFLAHPKVIRAEAPATLDPDEQAPEWLPGVFRIFKPTAIEKIVTQSQASDEAEMKALADRGITPVVVPDNDPDHQGTVYDEDEPAGELFNGNGAPTRSVVDMGAEEAAETFGTSVAAEEAAIQEECDRAAGRA